MKRHKTIAARCFLAVFAICLGAAFAFAGQAGVGLNNQLPAHQHRGSSDGGVLQGLSPVGTFLINTNNAGNITVSTSLAGSIFMWKPGTANFTAGTFATVNGAYTANMGTNTFNLGYENLVKAHYSAVIGNYNEASSWRSSQFIFGDYLKTTATSSVMLGHGANVYPNSVSNSSGTVKIYSGAWNPSITVAQASAWATPGGVTLASTTVQGSITAATFHGDGSNLVNVPSAGVGLMYINADGNISIASTVVPDTYLEINADGNLSFL